MAVKILALDAGTIVPLLAVAVTLGGAAYSYSEARTANRLTVLADFLREYRDLEPERYYILNGLSEQSAADGIQGLSESVRPNVVKVAYYLDALALLVEKGLIDEADIIQLLGGSIQRQYQALLPFIEVERGIRPEPIYMRGFEHLAALARDKQAVRESASPPEYEHLRRF